MSNLHPTFQQVVTRMGLVPAVSAAKKAQDPVDAAIALLASNATRLTESQLDKLGEVFNAALLNDDGVPCRPYENVDLETLLQDVREAKHQSEGPDYYEIDAPSLSGSYARERAEACAR